LSIRLLALDLDGTILDSEMRVSPRTRQAMSQAQARGVHVTLASGRPYHNVRHFANDLGIRDPVICYQGAVVQDMLTEEIYFYRGVPIPLAYEAIGLIRQQGWALCVHLDDRLYAERFTPAVRFYAEYSPIKERLCQVADLRAALYQEPTKLVVIVDAEQGAEVSARLGSHFQGRLQVVRSYPRFVEATNLAATKGQALSFLAHRLGVPRAETMAIGDNDNDTDMVTWAGLGVAMGNASASVKAAADYVAPSIAEDGAAEAIERLVLGRGHV